MNRWQVGDVRITRIVEMEVVGGTRFILPQATPEAVSPMQWLVPHFATPEGKLIMSVHALVIETPNRLMLVDTCIGNDKVRTFPGDIGSSLTHGYADMSMTQCGGIVHTISCYGDKVTILNELSDDLQFLCWVNSRKHIS